MRDRIELVGDAALTERQAAALYKAATHVIMQHDLNEDDEAIKPIERQRLAEAVNKLERALGVYRPEY
jgi:hypothetical protein